MHTSNLDLYDQPARPAHGPTGNTLESRGDECALLAALSFSWARAYRELLVSGELRGRYDRSRIG